MGEPKLLLPWPASQQSASQQSASSRAQSTVIDRVLEAWTSSRVTETIVVIRRDDVALRDACKRWPVSIVHPLEATEDMKGSVCVGLQTLLSRGTLAPGARCFIAPADLPGLSSQVIDGLIDSRSGDRTILLPRFGPTLEASIAGHPALLPWELTAEIFALGQREGVDAIVKRHPQEFVLFPPELTVTDIDTPEDYQTALKSAQP